jgi:TonB family protein
MKRILGLLFLFTTIAGLTDAKPSWRALDHPVPSYPEAAKQQHLSGNALFELHIRGDGIVERVATVTSTGHALLDESAVAALRRWRFDPQIPIKTLRVPVRYIDGPPRIDDVMRQPETHGYSKVITLFSRKKA